MISNSVANYYRKKELLPEQTIVCMEYAMQAFENELSKFVMFAIAFGVAGFWTEFLLTYVVLVSVRVFAGGIHCKTYWRCAFVSFIMLVFCIVMARLSVPYASWAFAIAMVSVAFPLLLAPMTPSFRIIKSDKHKIVLKVLAMLLSLGWILLAGFVITDPVSAAVVVTTVSVANYQLIIPPLIQRKKQRG